MMGWWAVICLGLSVALLVPSPAGRLRRLRAPAARPVPGWLHRILRDGTGMAWRRRLGIGAAVGVAAAVLLSGPWALPLGAGTAAVTVVALGWVRVTHPAHERLRRELPTTLELIAACVEAGSPPAVAIDVVAGVVAPTTRDYLTRISARLRIGVPAAEAWLAEVDHPVWGGVARDLARTAKSGTAVESALRVHAEEMRRRSHEQATRAARAVGVKSVMPLMICFLPAFIAVGIVPIIAGLALDLW